VHKTLGDFEVLILLALVRLKEEAYGAALHREIEERTGRSIAIGAVYTGLARLEKSGLVTAEIGEPTPERGGRRKKFYQLESSGAAALARSLTAHRSMMEGIEAELDLLAAGGGEGGAT
jgi:DNA-binding PadR family transcriptional regulator